MRFRHVLRQLARTPMFAAITLAVAIGANSAIFSVINGVILKRAHARGDLLEVARAHFIYAGDAGDRGSMALLIGLIGIYGVISYVVSQRRREIGIRIALGAPRRELVRMFVAYGFVLALIGAACGLAGASALTRLLGSGLIAAAVAASYLPALRSMKIDPVEALRSE